MAGDLSTVQPLAVEVAASSSPVPSALLQGEAGTEAVSTGQARLSALPSSSPSAPSWQGRKASVWDRELHPALLFSSTLLPITPVLEANLMLPAEHHESAGLRPMVLWLFVITTL